MKIGAQLYTVRDLTKTRDGLVKVLDAVAKIGYEGVQLSAVGCMNGDNPEVTTQDAANLLQERNLICAATHRSWEQLSQNTAEEVNFHKTLHCTYTAIGVPPKSASEGGLPGYQTWLKEAQATAKQLNVAGIEFGYHNHALEFERMDNGRRPYDVLIEEAPWLMLELDTYWVHVAGLEVTPLVEKLFNRLPVVHVKDVAPFGWELDYAPVGEGNLDWPTILPALKKAGTQWLLVEQDDCRRDPLDCLKSSHDYLRKNLP